MTDATLSDPQACRVEARPSGAAVTPRKHEHHAPPFTGRVENAGGRSATLCIKSATLVHEMRVILMNEWAANLPPEDSLDLRNVDARALQHESPDSQASSIVSSVLRDDSDAVAHPLEEPIYPHRDSGPIPRIT
jgi:hypothetical protein